MAFYQVNQLAVWASEPISKTPKGRVLLIHGLSEHSGRHLETEKALLDSDFSVVRFDLRGAGQSGGRRQWVRSFEDYIDDVSTVYRWICRELEPTPLYLFGHSLGGAIGISFLEYYQKAFRGCILSAPAYLLGGAINPLVVAIGRQLVKVAPTLRIPATSNKSAISKDPSAVKAFLEDPLCCHTTTLNQGKAILEQLPKVPTIISKIEIPLLLLHGSSDQIVRLEGSFELLMRAKSKNKTLSIIPGGYHEPHHDVEREEYLSSIRRWLMHQSSFEV